MNTKFLNSIIFAISMSVTSANADTVSVLFNGDSASAEYLYNTELVDGYWESTFDSAILNFGGITYTYDSTTNTLTDRGFDGFHNFYVLTQGAVIPFSGSPLTADTISSVSFDGQFFIDSDTGFATMFYSGDGTSYTGANFKIFGDQDYWGDGSIARDRFFTSTSFDTVTITTVSAVPVPAAAWLFASGGLGLIGIARRKPSKTA